MLNYNEYNIIKSFCDYLLGNDIPLKEYQSRDYFSPYTYYDGDYRDDYMFLFESVNYSYSSDIIKKQLKTNTYKFNIEDFKIIKTYYPQLLQNIKNSTDKAVKSLMMTYNIEDWQIYVVNKELDNKSKYDEFNDIKYSSDFIYIFIPNIGDNIKKVDKMMNAYGYFNSTILNDYGYFYEKYTKIRDWVTLKYEPKHQPFINKIIKEQGKLYHVSPSYNREKILKRGLIPKDKNDKLKTDGRVYCLLTLDFNGYSLTNKRIINVISQLYNVKKYYDKNSKYIKAYDIYEIDTTNLNANFSIDHNFNNEAVYTYDNIPSTNIKLLDTINIY